MLNSHYSITDANTAKVNLIRSHVIYNKSYNDNMQTHKRKNKRNNLVNGVLQLYLFTTITNIINTHTYDKFFNFGLAEYVCHVRVGG